ncbi:MAG: GIN domain-containing protein [Spirochaetia bacterium]
MKKQLSILIVLFSLILMPELLFAGGVTEGITGKGERVSREYAVESFDSVKATHGFALTISYGSTSRVEITASENIHDYIDVHLTGSTLVITLESGRSYRAGKLEADIVMPRLQELNLSGGGTAEINEGFPETGTFVLRCTGGSGVEVDRMTCGILFADLSGGGGLLGEFTVTEKAEFELSGGSNINIRGNVPELTLRQSGGGTSDLSDFFALEADIDISGGGTSRVAVENKIRIEASGGAQVLYLDSGSFQPDVEKDVSGGASIRPY